MPIQIVGVESTELFVGDPSRPEQVVRVTVTGPPGPLTITVTGDGVATPSPVPARLEDLPRNGPRPRDLVPPELTVEVPVRFAPGTPPGTDRQAIVTATPGPAGTGVQAAASTEVTLTAAEPGWTMFLVSHFHYDPVWWTTQAAYTSSWDELDWPGSPRGDFQHTGFELVRAHLEHAREDPDYRFVLAETDYLKPYWDSFPTDRSYLRQLLAEGRCELMGGTYNEPNTNLTSAETTIRNLVYGAGYQRDVLGGDPATAWQLDAFGHDPQFPGLAAAAGLSSSSWARGPFHQWGPLQPSPGAPHRHARLMQFPSEFEWISPSGQGLLTSYMTAHYSAGWAMDSAATLAGAEDAVYQLFVALKPAAATRNVLLPVGTDYTPPNKWVTAIHRDWAARYAWPRFVCAVPRDFFAAVRAELAATGRRLTPQTRDMNPVYTGKDVSFVDTKQAHRRAEVTLADAERFGTFAALYGPARYPAAALDKAWRLLVFGAHHDAITGSESDQVYLDLLAGWREAADLAGEVHGAALRLLADRIDTRGAGTPIVIFNGLSLPRTDLVRLRVPLPTGAPGLSLMDDNGTAVPFLAEGVDATGATLTFLAGDVPSTGWRVYRLVPADRPLAAAGWQTEAGRPRQPGPLVAGNEHYRVEIDPARGGCVSRLTDLRAGLELLPPDRVGNELLVYDEYPQHPRLAEGPWQLMPTGPPRVGSADAPAASARAESCPIGRRVLVSGCVGPTVDYRQRLTLWTGVSRVDCTTEVVDFRGTDQLVRLRWPTAVRGGLPVSEVAAAVVGRGFGIIDVDSEHAPWTLDNPAYRWFGVGATARIRLRDPGPDPAAANTGSVERAIGVAEVVTDAALATAPELRELAVALARVGVTATVSVDSGSRYGFLDVDSNLPDVRIAIGGPRHNAVTAAVLAAAGPGYAAELARQLAAGPVARVWVPAERPLVEVWGPNADLRGVRALPVLVVAGRDDAAVRTAVVDLAADLADAVIEVPQPAELQAAEPGLADATVALVNRGLPGFAVDRTGALHLSLLRSCTGWPSGGWSDPPRRTTPDGTGFQLQHWTHNFEAALVSGRGDWRTTGVVAAGESFAAPLAAVLAEPGAGPLPPIGALLTVEPPGAATVTAVKPAGNPLASGSTEVMDPRAGITVRLVEPHGRAATVRLRTALPLVAAFTADLLERPVERLPVEPDGSISVSLPGAGVATVVLRPAATGDAAPAGAAVEDRPLGRDREIGQPVYVRYWLHNAGPAPLGNLPVSVHAEPAMADGSAPFGLRVSVGSSLVDTPWNAAVGVTVPAGWTATPPEWPVAVPPGGAVERDVRIIPAPAALAGDHLVTVWLADAGQRFADVVTVRVPGPVAGTIGPGGLDVELDNRTILVRPGERAVLRGRIRNRFRSPIDALAQLIGPADTWDLTPTGALAVAVAADGVARLEFPVEVPADASPGSWWLLVKVTCAGRVRYTESVRLSVDRSAGRRLR